MENVFSIFYNSSNSILLVNTFGQIRELYTPFRVKVIEDILGLIIGEYIYVEVVAESLDGKLLFITSNGVYFHNSFRIIASF